MEAVEFYRKSVWYIPTASFCICPHRCVKDKSASVIWFVSVYMSVYECVYVSVCVCVWCAFMAFLSLRFLLSFTVYYKT